MTGADSGDRPLKRFGHPGANGMGGWVRVKEVWAGFDRRREGQTKGRRGQAGAARADEGPCDGKFRALRHGAEDSKERRSIE